MVVDRLPSINAREKRVHQHQLFDFVRKLRRISVCDHQSDVVADNDRAVDAEALHERMHPGRSVLHVKAVSRNVRVANTR